MEAEFLTIQEVAALLRVRDSTIYRYVQTGSLPAVKINNTIYRIRSDALAKFLDRNKTEKEK
jgi:excisionase family DNA binding protein